MIESFVSLISVGSQDSLNLLKQIGDLKLIFKMYKPFIVAILLVFFVVKIDSVEVAISIKVSLNKNLLHKHHFNVILNSLSLG